MKISFCSIGFQKNKWGKDRVAEVPLTQILTILGKDGAGYDGVEIWYPHLEGADLPTLCARLAAAQLAVPMVSSYYDFTSTDESAAESINHARKVIADAVALRARGVRIFTGRCGSDVATPEQWDRGVRALQTVADAAAEHGIRLACETHPHNLMDTVASSLELIRRVDRRNVGLILQPSTFVNDYQAACEALAPHAFHVHASNGMTGTRGSFAEGAMDYRKIAAILRKHGFEGYVSVEWMGAEPERVARQELPFLRSALA